MTIRLATNNTSPVRLRQIKLFKCFYVVMCLQQKVAEVDYLTVNKCC